MNITLHDNCTLSTDRFGNSDSSLLIDNNYASIPPGVYFDPATEGFTIAFWFKLLSFIENQTLLKFGIKEIGSLPEAISNDDIRVGISNDGNFVQLELFNQGRKQQYILTSVSIKVNEWHYVAISLQNDQINFFVNGSQKMHYIDSG